MRITVVALALALTLAACATEKPVRSGPPDYARQLPLGRSALRKVPPGGKVPDPAVAFRARDPELVAAIDDSLKWLAAPSSRKYFPFENVCTHLQMKQGLEEFRAILTTSRSAEEFRELFFERFEIWQSVGWDGQGTVLFTGYYAPEFPASKVRTERFRYPLYQRPTNLVTDPATGEPKGMRRRDGTIGPWPPRREIEESGMLAGTELVWLESELDAYICHVNGSAKLSLPDGSVLYVGYAGKTDRPYSGLGAALVREEVIHETKLGLPAIREAYEKDPDLVRRLMYENESYVFFQRYDGADWPSGSLGVKVHARASLATDKAIYPRGALVLVATHAVKLTRGKEEFLRFLLDQDTGGAIKAPGRADIFMGVGPDAEVLAGGQYAEGGLFYFFLKPRLVTPEP